MAQALSAGRLRRYAYATMKTKSKIQEVMPIWGDAGAVHAYFGIGRSTLYKLVADGKIRSASLRERGKLRGKRLFLLSSIGAFIESRATGGEVGPNNGSLDFSI
jgi:hypothetical protein